ncbi:outer membrane beta-barrel family protein [Parabacteroides sp. Marseille-P3160]|uniref:outer membrane beta-barrel family protein n=1 Tax=Parabacteroides sp. Marseille-P3160 TaxID=1917887 RepID=UPI00135ADDFE|nr:outer membrane beta-barrel family protein [Parabacteroides sp. Marseille-P3160]
MKKNILLTALFAMVSIITGFSQVITGTVTNANQQAIPFANVMLYSLPDSSFVAGTVTDERGEFSLNGISNTKCFLRTSFVGYETNTSDAINKQRIILLPSGNELAQVVVTTSPKIFKSENGAIVANVKNTVLATLPTANEVIAQMPLISEENGAFTVFGKGTPIIYINSRLVRDNNELNKLSPKDIKSIRIITMPGSEYDASVKSVIKIVTDRPVGEGLGGTLFTKQAYSNRYLGNETAVLTYRQGAWDIFGTLDFLSGKSKNETNTRQYINLQDSTITQSMFVQSRMNINSFEPEFGVNYNPTKKISAGIKYNGSMRKYHVYRNSPIESITPSTIESMNEDANLKTKNKLNQLNGYFDGELIESKLYLNISLDYLNSKNTTDQNTSLTSTQVDVINTFNIQKNNLFAVKDIFTYNLGRGNVTFGNDFSKTEVKQTYTINQSDLGITDSDSKLNQNKNALFASYQYQFGKYGMKIGLRYEHVDFDYYSNGIRNDEQSKKYNELFPSMFLSYSSAKLRLNFGYERKINYPSYSQLSSNIQYSSPFLYQGGNPNLKPSISNELTGNVSWRNWLLFANYSRKKDEIQRLFSQYEDRPIILFKVENIPSSESMNIGLSYNPTIGLWNPRFEMAVSNQWLHLSDTDNQYSHGRWMAKWNNTFALVKNYIFRANIYYASSGNFGPVYTKRFWGVDIKCTKELLDKNLSIMLGVDDVFNSNRTKWNMIYQNISMDYDSNMHTRQIYLTLTYRFNQSKGKYKGRQAIDEINRLR